MKGSCIRGLVEGYPEGTQDSESLSMGGKRQMP